MARRRGKPEYDDDDDAPRSPHHVSTRLAWMVLLGGGLLLATRVSVATIVRVHGDGMAPTLLDGEQVVLIREPWSLERGDVVVYDPDAALGLSAPPSTAADEPNGGPGGREFPDLRHDPERDLRNTAVVDREELDDNWKTVQQRSAGIARRSGSALRLGRIIAAPGDAVTFYVPGAVLGIAINGAPLVHKPGDPIRIRLSDDPDAGSKPAVHPVAYEVTGERRYPILEPTTAGQVAWEGLALPPAGDGPAELVLEGYLVLADHRRAGQCCDSRALGLVPTSAFAGRVIMRLAGDPAATPDLDPQTRGILWNP